MTLLDFVALTVLLAVASYWVVESLSTAIRDDGRQTREAIHEVKRAIELSAPVPEVIVAPVSEADRMTREALDRAASERRDPFGEMVAEMRQGNSDDLPLTRALLSRQPATHDSESQS